MAITRIGGAADGAGLARRDGLAKHAAKKHPAKQHAEKKHAAKKHPGKEAAKKAAKHLGKKAAKHVLEGSAVSREPAGDEQLTDPASELSRAFHHLQRAGAVISLLEQESGGDLRLLLEHGIDLYRTAMRSQVTGGRSRCAFGLLRAAEHLGMAGLYTARGEHRAEVPPPPRMMVEEHLRALGPRLDRLKRSDREHGRRLEAMAKELLRRAGESEGDQHLEYELVMAADGICSALEEGL